MTNNIAILIGNANYKNLSKLDCCINDVTAIKELVTATQKFSAVELIVDSNAASMKDQLRLLFSKNTIVSEVFFYFTGHGYLQDREFYFCCSDFNPKKANETGLSLTSLHDLLRGSKADTVIQVVDACSSGINLIKADQNPLKRAGEFKKFIRISSCLEDQDSLAGDPLSDFTDHFIASALAKETGPIYYQDIIDRLADIYSGSAERNPLFIYQSTGRDIFADDASLLADLRQKRNKIAKAKDEKDKEGNKNNKIISVDERLAKLDLGLVSENEAREYINTLESNFSNIIQADASLKCLYKTEFSTYDSYAGLSEDNTRSIVRALEKQNRVDNFVEAKSEIIRPKSRSMLQAGLGNALSNDYFEPFYEYTLESKCGLEKLHIIIELKPVFQSMPKIDLNVIIVPSLDFCYVFSFTESHKRTSWERFDSDPTDMEWTWFRGNWRESNEWIAKRSIEKLNKYALQHADNVVTLLSESVKRP